MQVGARHILLIEDHMLFAETLTYLLEECAVPPWRVTVQGTLATALDWLQDHLPTLILLDLNLPDSKEVATFERTWAVCARLDVPIIVLTALKGTHIEGRVIAEGALWYIDKGWLGAHLDEFLERLNDFVREANQCHDR